MCVKYIYTIYIYYVYVYIYIHTIDMYIYILYIWSRSAARYPVPRWSPLLRSPAPCNAAASVCASTREDLVT